MAKKKKTKKSLPEELVDMKSQEEDSALHSIDFEKSLALDPFAIDENNPPPPPETQVQPPENTLRIVEDQAKKAAKEKTETKVSWGAPASQKKPPAPSAPDRYIVNSVEATLKQSEHLRIAQHKLNALEEEVQKLRRDNQELASAGETFKKINEEYYGTIENLKTKIGDQKQTYTQEVELLKKINRGKDKQIVDLKQEIDDLKSQIDNNFRGLRKREKDLEHRLEIAKIEEQAVIRSKDQLILDLKRKIDRLNRESKNFRQKSQENYRELQKKQQVVRGVIRALRIALTKLEGEDDSDVEFNFGSSKGDDEGQS